MPRSRSPRGPATAYEAWLRAREVTWDERLQLKDLGAPHGWGLVCQKCIPKGTRIIHVPRSAALTADAVVDLLPAELEELRKFDESRDSQLPLVLALLLADDSWLPKLRVTPRHVDLAWSCRSAALGSAVTAALQGTELEEVVQMKQRRVQREFDLLEPVLREKRITLEDYISACAVIMSRVQPWWNGSLVPFVDQANHSCQPHVEFRLRKGQVEGKALRTIEAGEVFQSYGELSTADSLYRYGFATPAAAASAIRVSCRDTVTVGVPELRTLKSAKRVEGLKNLGLLEESPWDGLEAPCLELSVSRRPHLAAGGVRNLRRLWALCHCLLLPEEAWRSAAETGQKALEALGVPVKAGASWQPSPSVLKLCVKMLEVRSKRLGTLEEEERSYDKAVADEVEPIHLGLQKLRVIEARLLDRILSYVRGLLDAAA